MKDCQTIHALLSLYQDGQLSSRDQNRVDRHLESCGDARLELEKLKSLRKSLLALPEPKMPSDLHDRIMTRVHGSPLPQPYHLWPWSAGLVAAAAMITVILLNPELLQRKPLGVAQLPQAQDQKKASQNLGAPAAAPFSEKTKSHNQFQNDSSDYATKDTLANQQVAMAPQAPEAAAAPPPKAEESRDLSVNGASADASRPAPEALSIKSAKKVSARASAAAAPSSYPGVNLSVTGAGLSSAPPTPNPTEGMIRTLTLSKEISASSWSGTYAPVTVESQELITDADTFKQRWQAFRSDETPPEVDFTAQAVVVLTAGPKPTTGYSIHAGQLEEKADQLVIHTKVEVPLPGQPTGQMFTYPWSMQVIPKPAKPVVFQKD